MSRLFDALQRSGVEQDRGRVSGHCIRGNAGIRDATRRRKRRRIKCFPPTFPPMSRFPLKGLAASCVFSEPETLAAEKFRFLGVRMRQLQQTRPIKKVLVTSTIARRRQGWCSPNLAAVLASRKRHRVLLIDGDLRRPVLADKFGLGRLNGLAEWLQGESQALSNIYHLAVPDFWLMPAGHPPTNPLELMQSGRLSSLMAQVTNLFDWIIVDSPPLLPLADTSVWTRVTDGALLVVREGTAEKDPLKRALESLKKADLLGVVLNGSSNGNHHNYYQRYAAARNSVKS